MIDFLVIGGGIAGLSAGARLSALGRVTVLEAEDALGYHASGRSAALFEENYGPPSVVALNRAGAAFFHDKTSNYLTPRGLMLLGKKDEAEAFAQDADELGMTPINVQDAIARVPILNPETVGFAGESSSAFDIDTDRLLQDFAKIVRVNGGDVLTKSRVSAIRKDRYWIVEAGRAFESRTLVNAAGAWADQIAALAGIKPIGIVPKRRSMGRIPAPGGHDVRCWPMMLGVNEAWYAKPDAGKLLVSPSEADPVAPHDAFADDMVLAEGIARYEEMVTEPVMRLEANWAGLRSFAPDGTLVLGPDPFDPSFVWSAGQGGYGFQTAPAASLLIADLIAGKPSELDDKTVAALRPERLHR
ncbi:MULTISPECIES: FAD-binding oxidoreductase [unclassified Ruegeria]|uniref:NAD(P)/FAD-dependent oxidoreductase n=1 Tax=unclassified Ruegeria TaxID=2625375 RepID=UPI0014884FB6|nr:MULTISPECIES: FAD-binding oxidoreductase [unclassified Ruegeria]